MPAFLSLVTANRQRGILVQHVEEHMPVRGQLGRCDLRAQCERAQLADSCADASELQGQALGLQAEPEHVRRGMDSMSRRHVRNIPEPHGHLLAIAAERLAGPYPEHGAEPSPVLQLEPHLGESLGVEARVYAFL